MRGTETVVGLSAVLLLALSGCSTVGSQVLSNLQGCERHYDGVVSAGLGAGFSGSVKIDCAATTKPESTEEPILLPSLP